MLISAKVKPTTSNKFIIGVFTDPQFSNTLKRFMAIEMDSSGFWMTRSSSSGFLRQQIGTTVPVAGTTYFLELIIRDGAGDGLNSIAYVFSNNGGSSNPPTLLGSLTMSTQFAWSTAVYYGSGVYMSGTSPLSDYTVSEYRNHKMVHN